MQIAIWLFLSFKAQYLIYEKLREEGFMTGLEVRLTVEIMAPTSQVGRIIGKGGANVRELQRLTNAMIKLPEQGTSTGEETPVHINGNFYSVQVCYSWPSPEVTMSE